MTLKLIIDGDEITEWQNVSIRRSMTSLADSFNLVLVNRNVDVAEGKICQVEYDGQTIITGYIDSVSINYSANSLSVSVEGRSKSSDLVDCSAIDERGSGQFRDMTVLQICERIAGFYGISIVPTDAARKATPIKKFTIETGETAYEAILRAVKMRGLLAYSDPLGRVIIGTADDSVDASDHISDESNVLSATSKRSYKDRFSTYTGKSQPTGKTGKSRSLSSVFDSALNRQRIKIIIAENLEYGDSLKSRLQWQKNVDIGKSKTVQYTVAGWSQVTGGLWKPNTLINVVDSTLGINDNLLLTEVTYNLSVNDGETTSLSLQPRESLTVEPEVRARKAQSNSFFGGL